MQATEKNLSSVLKHEWPASAVAYSSAAYSRHLGSPLGSLQAWGWRAEWPKTSSMRLLPLLPSKQLVSFSCSLAGKLLGNVYTSTFSKTLVITHQFESLLASSAFLREVKLWDVDKAIKMEWLLNQVQKHHDNSASLVASMQTQICVSCDSISVSTWSPGTTQGCPLAFTWICQELNLFLYYLTF